MVVQDNTAKAQQPMPVTRCMTWIGYAIHHCATHSLHFPDAPFGDMYLRMRRIGKASQLNHAGFSCAEGAGCSAHHAATGGRGIRTSPPLRLGSPSRQDAQSLILSLSVLHNLFIFAKRGACS